jgi:predicted DNA-binding transcriptional regulator YafY
MSRDLHDKAGPLTPSCQERSLRRSDRLFDIIQQLRTARVPTTAAALADSLEVNVRTIYRDIAVLQARRVPIEGAAGVGYLLRRGYDLPALTFSVEEREAINVGLRLLRRTGDVGLQKSAESVLSKLEVASPTCSPPSNEALFISGFGAPPSPAAPLSEVRAAIRNRRKLCIDYRNAEASQMRRIIWPLAVAYYIKATVIAGWCEARGDYRHFPTDRIQALTVLDSRFDDPGGELIAGWIRLPRFAEKVSEI